MFFSFLWKEYGRKVTLRTLLRGIKTLRFTSHVLIQVFRYHLSCERKIKPWIDPGLIVSTRFLCDLEH